MSNRDSHLSFGDALAVIALLGFIFGWIIMWSVALNQAAHDHTGAFVDLMLLAMTFIPPLWAADLISKIVRGV